ncbi:MAG: hypothetical protein RDO_1350 [Flavobacteriales endosymbiont of Rhyzopertha dominica]|nr:MAG: tRNA uridine-5-carboxymethylaminomethyl(34) synthesis GTPase MnmE [Candidatus Shikimatogenerans bostrichidophilus]
MNLINYYLIKNETITAISTPLGVGSISIIRISGNKCKSIIKNIFKRNNNKIVKYNKVNIGNIYENKEIIDQVVLLFYKKPKSYTGEDLVEINCHGSIYIQKRIINLIIKNGARVAKNGEFTYRAFLNKKINLLQAESILELIKSENKIEHKIAINNLLKTKLSKIIKIIENKILNIISNIEIILDFSETENININNKLIYKDILYIEKKIYKILINYKNIIFFKKGYYISIIGTVNTGKSTLMNILINENKSIVSKIAGTTRDVVEGNLKIKDFNFYLFDTAGIRKTKSYIEKIGIKKTFNSIKNSDIIFYIIDISKIKIINIINKINKIKKKYKKNNKEILFIFNKIDKLKKKEIKKYNKLLNIKIKKIFISAKKNIGINKIKNYLYKKIKRKLNNKEIYINNVRHYEEFKKLFKKIIIIKNKIINKLPLELLSIEIKYLLNILYNINGYIINNENILNNIFSKFCIGK